jgi:hypothetical protein
MNIDTMNNMRKTAGFILPVNHSFSVIAIGFYYSQVSWPKVKSCRCRQPDSTRREKKEMV